MLEQIQHKIDHKTKPLGALGRLEEIGTQICLVQETLSPQLRQPAILVFAADHGIAQSGVSAYPSEVTAQMVLNFLQGGAAINVFSRQHEIALKIVDAGVNFEFPENENLIDAKIAKGTQNYLFGDAITAIQLQLCFDKAGRLIEDLAQQGCNVIGFGEMGIGNTSSASLLMSVLCEIPIEDCVGHGTGLDDAQLTHKIETLKKVLAQHSKPANAKEALCKFGGFEIAQMCGAMLEAYEQNMLILVDGFITTSAFLCAYEINPSIRKNAVFCHQSGEQGHRRMIEHLQGAALLNLGMRLGEGTGCALAYPIIQSAVNFVNEMASFESAGVSNKG
ncbi:MAG: nicotinate-nucleotide--dimethylbenzimidazole phosphoribosyltransferase [Phaeodactylibacter sp.]|nr:nicotinate-nucleotide--dimethylbenzimidazole phosphoribosyltransferase [Phaeodactylibacter sp.]